MCRKAQPPGAGRMVVGQLEVGPAAGGIDNGTSVEFTGRGRDAEWTLALNPLHSCFLKRGYAGILCGIPKGDIKVVTSDTGRRRVDRHANHASIQEEP